MEQIQVTKNGEGNLSIGNSSARRAKRVNDLEEIVLGTREGVCPFCGEWKTLLLLREGTSSCRGCLEILLGMMEIALNPVTGEELFEKTCELAKRVQWLEKTSG